MMHYDPTCIDKTSTQSGTDLRKLGLRGPSVPVLELKSTSPAGRLPVLELKDKGTGTPGRAGEYGYSPTGTSLETVKYTQTKGGAVNEIVAIPGTNELRAWVSWGYPPAAEDYPNTVAFGEVVSILDLAGKSFLDLFARPVPLMSKDELKELALASFLKGPKSSYWNKSFYSSKGLVPVPRWTADTASAFRFALDVLRQQKLGAAAQQAKEQKQEQRAAARQAEKSKLADLAAQAQQLFAELVKLTGMTQREYESIKDSLGVRGNVFSEGDFEILIAKLQSLLATAKASTPKVPRTPDRPQERQTTPSTTTTQTTTSTPATTTTDRKSTRLNSSH